MVLQVTNKYNGLIATVLALSQQRCYSVSLYTILLLYSLSQMKVFVRWLLLI